MVIDGDGHIVEPISVWKDYVPKKYHDQIYAKFADDGSAKAIVVGNVYWDLQPYTGRKDIGTGDFVTPGGMKEKNHRGRKWEEGAVGGYDSRERLRIHDAEGIDAAVVFPTLGMDFANTVTDPKIAGVACEAINRWSADFCRIAPAELFAVACINTTDPAAGAEELRRCVKEYGSVAGFIRSTPTADGRWIDHESMEPIWKAAADLNVPITIHNNTTPLAPWAGKERIKNLILGHSVAHPFEAMLAFGGLLQGRIFERYPSLRVGFMESGCGWAPFWVERLEEHVEMLGWMTDPRMKLDPCEVFSERCIVGTEAEEKEVKHVQETFTEENVMWASDYPHFDTESPFVLPRPELTDSQRDGMYRRAAAKFYNLDQEAIKRSNAQRRGTM